MSIVLNIFAGSNTTDIAAESLNRSWIAFEINQTYFVASAFRFFNAKLDENTIKKLYKKLSSEKIDKTLDLSQAGWRYLVL